MNLIKDRDEIKEMRRAVRGKMIGAKDDDTRQKWANIWNGMNGLMRGRILPDTPEEIAKWAAGEPSELDPLIS